MTHSSEPARSRLSLAYLMLIMLLLGFSSGLPLIATGSTLQAWMTEDNFNLKELSLYSLVGLPYTIKFLWSPCFDRFVPPILGRRRGWLFITQLCTFLAFASFSFISPSRNAPMLVVAAVMLTFFSASQDIVADAYRRDILRDKELGLGTGYFITGYRLGMIVTSAGALKLAEIYSWNNTYLLVACCMAAGLIGTLIAPEPEIVGAPPRSFEEAVKLPLLSFFRLPGALEILCFILLFKLGDTLASSLVTRFFLDHGFSKGTIAGVGKTFGLMATIGGGIFGGYGVLHLGINRALWVFGFLQAVTIPAFAVLAGQPGTYEGLVCAVGLENFTSGLGTAAYAAFMGALCDRRFSATQYALLSSLMGIPRAILSAPMGTVADSLGWPGYFCFCAAMALPGMFMLFRIAPWSSKVAAAS